jgi:hemoglobin-like flavoprotein
MTPREIELVQTSFAKVVPIADVAADLFYRRVFEVAPGVRPLFKGDMTEQGRKLMATLGTVVRSLDNLGPILPVARALAVRHIAYGVQADHYPVVGDALLWTLGQGLGEAFTPETRDAWATAYSALSGVMIEAAYKDQA